MLYLLPFPNDSVDVIERMGIEYYYIHALMEVVLVLAEVLLQ